MIEEAEANEQNGGDKVRIAVSLSLEIKAVSICECVNLSANVNSRYHTHQSYHNQSHVTECVER